MFARSIVGGPRLGDANAFPLHTPVLLHSNPTKAALLGAGGTLRDALDDTYDQVARSWSRCGLRRA